MDSYKSAWVLFLAIGSLAFWGVASLPRTPQTFALKDLEDRTVPKVVANEVVMREPLARNSAAAKGASDRWLDAPATPPIRPARVARIQPSPAAQTREVSEPPRPRSREQFREQLAARRPADIAVRDGATRVNGHLLNVLAVCELTDERTLCWDLKGNTDAPLAEEMRAAMARQAPGALESAHRWAVVADDDPLVRLGGLWLDPDDDPESGLLRPQHSGELIGLNQPGRRVQIVQLSGSTRLQYILPNAKFSAQLPAEIGATSPLLGESIRVVAIDDLGEGPTRSMVRLELPGERTLNGRWSARLFDRSGRPIQAVDAQGKPADSGLMDLVGVRAQSEAGFTTISIRTNVHPESIGKIVLTVTQKARIDFLDLPESP